MEPLSRGSRLLTLEDRLYRAVFLELAILRIRFRQ
jgi:hypothetical protein